MFNSHASSFDCNIGDEFLSSEFFDSIESVERCSDGSLESDDSTTHNNLNTSNKNEFDLTDIDIKDEITFLSDTSSVIDTDINISDASSPTNDVNILEESPILDIESFQWNETELSNIQPTEDQSILIDDEQFDNNHIKETLLEYLEPVQTIPQDQIKLSNQVFNKRPVKVTNIIKEPITKLHKINSVKNFGKKSVKTITTLPSHSFIKQHKFRPIILPDGVIKTGFKIIPHNNLLKNNESRFTTNSTYKRQREPTFTTEPISTTNIKRIKVSNGTNDLKTNRIQIITVPNNNNNIKSIVKVDSQNELKNIKVNNEEFKGEKKVRYITIPRLNNNKSCVKTHHSVSSQQECRKPVELSPEEIKGLDKLGIQLPAFHPLTKSQEGALKRVRRKIRNKISAQDSRKRKKEYVDSLEEKVRRGSEENRTLKKRINELQNTYNKLAVHMVRLQNFLSNIVGHKVAPASGITLFMIAIFIITIRDMQLPKFETMNDCQEMGAISRSLLSVHKKMEEDKHIENVFIDSSEFIEMFMDNNENTTNEEKLMKLIKKFENDNNFSNNENQGNNNSKAPPDRNIFSLLIKSIVTLLTDNGLFNDLSKGNEDCINKKGFIEPDICENESDSIDKENQITERIRKFINSFVSNDAITTSNASISTTATVTAGNNPNDSE